MAKTKKTRKKPKKKAGSLLQQKLPLIIVLTACIAIGAVIVFQALRNKQTPTYYTVSTWSPEVAQQFFSSCTYVATAPGSTVSKQAAKVYCGCDINALQKIYKSDNELELTEKSWIKSGYPPSMISVMRECANQAHLPTSL